MLLSRRVASRSRLALLRFASLRRRFVRGHNQPASLAILFAKLKICAKRKCWFLIGSCPFSCIPCAHLSIRPSVVSRLSLAFAVGRDSSSFPLRLFADSVVELLPLVYSHVCCPYTSSCFFFIQLLSLFLYLVSYLVSTFSCESIAPGSQRSCPSMKRERTVKARSAIDEELPVQPLLSFATRGGEQERRQNVNQLYRRAPFG